LSVMDVDKLGFQLSVSDRWIEIAIYTQDGCQLIRLP
jgi:hypothetical protein